MGKYLDKIRQHEHREPIPSIDMGKAAASSTIQPGDRIEWRRAGTVQHGLVDFLHEDADGTMWVFCAQGATWAAVNMKFVTGSGHE